MLAVTRDPEIKRLAAGREAHMTPPAQQVPAAREPHGCPECGLLSCVCFDFDDQPDEGDYFDCGAWHDGVSWHCSKIGSEECDWDCPYPRDFR